MRTPAHALGISLLLLTALSCATGRPQLANSQLVGGTIDLVAPDLRGEEQRVADRTGQVRIVDFWATWCEPCHEQFQVLERLARTHQAEGLTVYAVSVDEDQAQLKAWLQARPLPFLVLWDKGGARLAERIGIERLPTTLLVDRAGRVRSVHQGFRIEDAGSLDREVQLLLKEPP
jgi:cytochrome c biogenesis protein CcmG/thiol:disulfide interchange protein DsbE